MTDPRQLLDQLDAAHQAAKGKRWAAERGDTQWAWYVIPEGSEDSFIAADASQLHAELIVGAVNALPQLTAALRAVLATCDDLARMARSLHTVPAAEAYDDAATSVRAAATAALSPAGPMSPSSPEDQQ